MKEWEGVVVDSVVLCKEKRHQDSKNGALKKRGALFLGGTLVGLLSWFLLEIRVDVGLVVAVVVGEDLKLQLRDIHPPSLRLLPSHGVVSICVAVSFVDVRIRLKMSKNRPNVKSQYSAHISHLAAKTEESTKQLISKLTLDCPRQPKSSKKSRKPKN